MKKKRGKRHQNLYFCIDFICICERKIRVYKNSYPRKKNGPIQKIKKVIKNKKKTLNKNQF